MASIDPIHRLPRSLSIPNAAFIACGVLKSLAKCVMDDVAVEAPPFPAHEVGMLSVSAVTAGTPSRTVHVREVCVSPVNEYTPVPHANGGRAVNKPMPPRIIVRPLC